MQIAKTLIRHWSDIHVRSISNRCQSKDLCYVGPNMVREGLFTSDISQCLSSMFPEYKGIYHHQLNTQSTWYSQHSFPGISSWTFRHIPPVTKTCTQMSPELVPFIPVVPNLYLPHQVYQIRSHHHKRETHSFRKLPPTFLVQNQLQSIHQVDSMVHNQRGNVRSPCWYVILHPQRSVQWWGELKVDWTLLWFESAPLLTHVVGGWLH